ncbi:MAG TPA: hypothetical protein VHS78_01535 [Candidatus Elarobacter sp.]|nr:hypothetical protein [Candidatus Elarobacter sp.]
MSARAGSLAALALACVLGAAPRTASATEPGYHTWFAGHIVSIDAKRGTLVIARGPTETSGPAVELCTLHHGPLKRLRAGMQVEAQADTRRHPWRILRLRIFEFKRTPRADTLAASAGASHG